jgi:hypothetical protein
MARWEVEYTDEFGEWWDGLTEAEQVSVDASVRLLEERGPQLGHPHSSGVERSRHPRMRELRVQHRGVRTACCTHSIRGARRSC